jgi:NodT family efflux transporter outer membrane factor (OMF) lipoprotein
MSKSLSLILAALLSLVLSGCASFAGIFPQFKSIDIGALAGSATMQPSQPYADWPREDWWQALQDPVLSGLIAQALADSPTLQAAQARLTRAGALADQAASALWPQLDAHASTSHERFSEHGLVPPPYAGTYRDINEMRLSAGWSLDFFGKDREALQAAIGELRANEVESRATRLRLAAAVARSYYQLSHLLALREVLVQRSRQRGDLAALVERRFKAGLDTAVELESARGVLPEIARDIAGLDEQIAISRHALALLLGQGPAAADALTPALPEIVALAPLALPASLPAELLGHRADVVAARWRVEAATHGLESTKALFYPNINLRAFTGFSAIGFSSWLDAGSRTPGIGLAISLPIFDAGRLRALYRSTAAQVDTAVAGYNSTLLGALRDVADQLSTLRALDIQRARQQEALASAARAYELAVRRFEAGITDRLNVLNVETNLIAQRRSAVDLQARWIDTRIRLIDALGGGFAAPDAPPLAAKPDPLIARH